MNPPEAKIIPFPPITKQQALKIAAQQCKSPDLKDFECFSEKPYRFSPFGDFPDDPCWYVRVTSKIPSGVLCSSGMVMISRVTGAVLYKGSAHDEG